MIGRGMTANQPALSPNSILSPSHYAFIAARKNSARGFKNIIFYFSFKNFVSSKVLKLTFLKLEKGGGGSRVFGTDITDIVLMRCKSSS